VAVCFPAGVIDNENGAIELDGISAAAGAGGYETLEDIAAGNAVGRRAAVNIDIAAVPKTFPPLPMGAAGRFEVKAIGLSYLRF